MNSEKRPVQILKHGRNLRAPAPKSSSMLPRDGREGGKVRRQLGEPG
jgi:hypothetical protein